MIIRIKNLRLKTTIGIYEWEEKIARDIIINLEIETDDEKAAISDAIADAIDYDSVVSKVKTLISSKRFYLVEKMAKETLDLIVRDKRVKRAKVEIDKVGAVEDVESFSVVLEAGAKN